MIPSANPSFYNYSIRIWLNRLCFLRATVHFFATKDSSLLHRVFKIYRVAAWCIILVDCHFVDCSPFMLSRLINMRLHVVGSWNLLWTTWKWISNCLTGFHAAQSSLSTLLWNWNGFALVDGLFVFLFCFFFLDPFLVWLCFSYHLVRQVNSTCWPLKLAPTPGCFSQASTKS